MGKQMEDYIQETSSVMVRNIEQRKELTKPLISWLLKEGIRQGKTLVIVASGSSYHAAQCALAFIEKSGPPDNAVCFYLL